MRRKHGYSISGEAHTRASRYDIALEVANHLGLSPSSANAVNRPETGGGGVPSPPESMNVDKIRCFEDEIAEGDRYYCKSASY